MSSPGENEVSLVEMFHITQCVNGPLGASTSTTVSARLFAVCGVPDIASGGEILLPSHVYCDGIVPLFSNAELDNTKDELLPVWKTFSCMSIVDIVKTMAETSVR